MGGGGTSAKANVAELHGVGQLAGLDLYKVLDISKAASDKEIRRAYKSLATKHHPDKGGDQDAFDLVQQAYDILSDKTLRAEFDRTGQVGRSVEDTFKEVFGQERFRQENEHAVNVTKLQDALIKSDKDGSRESFETFLRSRKFQSLDDSDIVNMFGVDRGAYDAVPLPRIKAHVASCAKLGAVGAVMEQQPLPQELLWGQVLVSVRLTPINQDDIAAMRTGETPHSLEHHKITSLPFVPGLEGLSVVTKVGPGCKTLAEGDWVIAIASGASGTGLWRSMAVVKETDLLKVPQNYLPPEYLAIHRELCTAYRLLEDHGNLRAGDWVVLNGATSSVGQCLVQLARILKLRTLCLVRDPSRERESDVKDSGSSTKALTSLAVDHFAKTSEWLKALGATEILPDIGAPRELLELTRQFSKPKLGLDCVGGISGMRVASCLADGAPLVVYGCMSTIPLPLAPEIVMKQNLKIQGFSLAHWVQEREPLRVARMLETLSHLVRAEKVAINFTEYDFATEFDEALEHAQERGRNTKCLLRVEDVGITY